MSHIESHQILESQIALGVDPRETATFVTLAIVAQTILFATLLLRFRRRALAAGEFRLAGDSLILSRDSGSMTRETGELSGLACSLGGADVRLRFSDGEMRLPGQWLPLGLKRTWKGLRTPGGSVVRLTRKAHPLLSALRERRPDLKPGLRLPVTLLILLIVPFVPDISNYPLYIEARRALKRHQAHEAAGKAFVEGRYAEACDAYRRALSSLRYDVYGSQDASLALLYCGDLKSALRAFVGYEVTPFWPVAADPAVLAKIRIAMGRYAQAEALLRPTPSYLLYVVLADKGRRPEADEVLERITQKGGFTEALLLRHKGRETESVGIVAALCERFRKNTTCPAMLLARRFEACFLAEGLDKTMEDPTLAAAVAALPGLRAELVRFVDREAPEVVGAARLAFGQASSVR